jgi:error-prone DNA polymerase
MLNNWPLGFYHPATLVKDAQRHGLRVLPIDVTRSGWLCALERTGEQTSPVGEDGHRTTDDGRRSTLALRLGLRYVAGLREDAAKRLEAARSAAPFSSIDDVALRAALRDDELQTLAHIGAFAAFDLTRREALWQAAVVPRDPLFARRSLMGPLSHRERGSDTVPLPQMSLQERTLADYKGTGMTVGPHLMQYLRNDLDAQGVLRTADLSKQRNGAWVKTAGLVIVRQRPGTAKGFCFLTLEDETGIGNAVVTPDFFRRHRAVIHTASLLMVEGPLQIVDGVIHLRARRFTPLQLPRQAIHQSGSGYRMRVTPQEDPLALPKSHDFR